MSVNIDKIGNYVRAVAVSVDIKELHSSITEDNIDEIILDALKSFNITLSDEEFQAVKRDVSWKYKVYSTPGESLIADYEQDNWYDEAKDNINPVFWTRYKNYLIDEKKFSPNIVSTLGEDTLDGKLMNYIGNPTSETPFLKRGLIIGDVQSGKTSTYIGLISKAADAGYKVFILLTGTIESLRQQTQERVEEGFIGINLSSDTTGGQRVGVGLDNQPIRAMALTSRKSDFTGNSDKIAVSLGDKEAVVFVIKKQTSVLKKLKEWLVSLNADPATQKIDMPMLMIDDEADNASINTKADREDPTKINRLIRELAGVFTKANYVGFTATPFANVFIDPQTPDKMEVEDLFPEDFIVALPTPSNYIGPDRIFGENSEFGKQLIYIEDAGREEVDGFPFYFKHKKEWEDDLPESLTDSIYTFYLANAIRDLRGDEKDHRSMMINISRFVMVQRYIKSIVEEIHFSAYRSIKYNLSLYFEESMKDTTLKRIYSCWQTHYEDNVEFTWDEIVKTLYNSIENIQLKVVNSGRNSEKLEYPKNESLRVIAIGGLSLSRGLTLEGLMVSYFYRNTCTYDVLMQMGRWFGYRRNYDDLFRIWSHEDSARWYGEITEAANQLKYDMTLMREQKLKPKAFGIRVRNNSQELQITASNKMRTAVDEYEYTSYFGGIVETPYITYNDEIQRYNYDQTILFVKQCLEMGLSFGMQDIAGQSAHNVINDVPRANICDFLHKIKISNYCTHFDTKQLVEIISGFAGHEIDKWDIAFMDGSKGLDAVKENICGREIYRVKRNTCNFEKDISRISLGTRGKLGGPSDGIAGLCNMNSKLATDILEKAKADYRSDYKIKNEGLEFTKDKVYPSDTWFKYIKDRKPLLIIYFLDITSKTQIKQSDDFKDKMQGKPVVGFAVGLPKNDKAQMISKNKYKAHKMYNWFDNEEINKEGEEE